ncbi:histidinol phosphate phosphatase [Candidatus Entotheonella serta]|nr:histidinol phosphate phosphatase [Candidatus Entotheonella serta]
MPDLPLKLEAAIRAAKAAGEVILPYFRTSLQVETKADQSPVTAADRAAEQTIVTALQHQFPDYGFLGEEYGERAGVADARWIIDPIDGTQNFIRGIPHFATLLALEEAGEITHGVIYAPAEQTLFYAARGFGAFTNDHQPLEVSAIDDLSQAMLVHGGLDILRQGDYWEGFTRLIDATARQRGFGDYFAHTFVFRGQAEVMVEADVKPWDLASLKIIAEESGGRFTDFTGNATIYGGNAVVSNRYVHTSVLDLLASTSEHS